MLAAPGFAQRTPPTTVGESATAEAGEAVDGSAVETGQVIETTEESQPASRAAEPPVAIPADFPNSVGTQVAERFPRLVYARDRNGTFKPLLNVPWERLQELLNADDQGQPLPVAPQYLVSHLRMTGEAFDNRAELSVEMKVETLDQSANSGGAGSGPSWTMIPLRFPDAYLLNEPEHEGTGRFLVVFDEREGHQGWIVHEGAGSHTIRLKLALPLKEGAGITQIQLSPPVATQSELQFDVRGTDIGGEADRGRKVTVTPLDEGRSRLTVSDLRNQLTLSWRRGAAITQQRPPNFDVKGEIRVSVDGPGAVRSQVTLDLQSYSRPIDQFYLRLPPHTTIVSGVQPGFEIVDANDADESSSTDSTPTKRVTLQKPSLQARLQLTTQTSHPGGATGPLSVGNFEVVGAIRQSGQITLLSNEDWRVDWVLGPAVRRILNPEGIETTDERRPLATFQYFRQPCRLEIEPRQQETRIGVRPSYRMHVAEDRVTLEAQFDYKLRGARLSFLNFALNGWTLDDVGPSGTVENDDLQTGNTDQVRLRLTKPTSGDLTLTLTLHRPITELRGTLRFGLPWPTADGVVPGTLFVTSADSVVLDYRLAEMTGLVPDVRLQSDAPPTSATPTGSANLVLGNSERSSGTAFRFLSDRALGEVVVDYQVREQEIRVRMDSELSVGNDAAQVTQHLSYRVLYRPTTQLTLDVPRPLFELLSNPRYRHLVEFRLDGQSLGREALEDVADSVDALRNVVPIHLPLSRPRLGNLDLMLRFPWQITGSAANEPRSIPLATPRDGRLMSNLATLAPTGRLRLDPLKELGWTLESSLVGSTNGGAIQLSSLQRSSAIRLNVTPLQEDASDRAAAGVTVVQRAWLQTWLTQRQQHDRVVMRVASGADEIRLRVPATVESLTALLDGELLPATRSERMEREWLLPLARRPSGEHTLELFLVHANRPPAGSLRIQWPEVLESTGPRRWFWQLIVPRDEHLWSYATQLSSANRWVREGWSWRREAIQTQPSLEEWTQASTQPPVPPGVNSYLFSSFDKPIPLQVRTTTRRTLVYGFSFLVLAIGAIWYYVPLIRHPLVVLLAGVVMLGLGWSYAELIWLIVQASLLGIALVVIAMATSLIARPATISESMTRSWSLRNESRGSTSPARRDGSAPHTTISVPGGPVPSAVPDSKV